MAKRTCTYMYGIKSPGGRYIQSFGKTGKDVIHTKNKKEAMLWDSFLDAQNVINDIPALAGYETFYVKVKLEDLKNEEVNDQFVYSRISSICC